MKIRQKLILLLLFIGFVPCLLISIFAYITISNELIDKSVDQLSSIAIKQAEEINTTVRQKQEKVIEFAVTYELKSALEQYLKSDTKASRSASLTTIIRDKKLASPDIQTIYLTDIAGNLLATTVVNAEEKNLPQKDFFVQLVKQNTIAIKEDISDSFKKLYITSTITIDRKDSAVLVVLFRIDDLAATVKDYTGLDKTGETIIADEDLSHNSISLFPLRFDKEAALKIKLNTLHLFPRKDTIYRDLIDYRDKKVIVVTKSVNFANWIIATKIDTDEVLEPVVVLRNILIVIFAVSSIVIILIALYFARIFTSPIITLTKKTEKIAQGDLNQRIDITSSDEIGTLASTFNTMTSKLQELYAGLEQKVREKTAQLSEKVSALELANAKDEAILVSIGDGLMVTDKDGKILIINPIAEQMLELNRQTTIGGELTTLIKLNEEDGAQVVKEKSPFYETIQSGKRVSKVYTILKKDGGKVSVNITSTPVILQSNIIGIIGIFRDITREKEVDRMKTEFISLASHQLRTPLSAIKWFTEMLLGGDAGKLTQEQNDFAKNISDSAERMIQLVNSLLNISRIESGRIIVNPAPTDLKQLVQGIINDLQAKIHERNQNLLVSVREDLPKINLDPQLIGQVYMNLLTNAIKYTQKGGEINVFISRKGEEIISQVTDNGYGIPKSEQGKMFQKFFRATNIIKVETDGTGLGMYLLKAIIESSKGRIWFESHTKEENLPQGRTGTTFFFSLPITGMIAKKGEVSLGS